MGAGISKGCILGSTGYNIPSNAVGIYTINIGNYRYIYVTTKKEQDHSLPTKVFLDLRPKGGGFEAC